jgi:hypothetical protein
MWFTGIKGDVSVKGLARVPVGASFLQLWEHLDIGYNGSSGADNNVVGLAHRGTRARVRQAWEPSERTGSRPHLAPKPFVWGPRGLIFRR